MHLKDSRQIGLGEIRMDEEYTWRGRTHTRDHSASQFVVLHRAELSHRGAGEIPRFYLCGVPARRSTRGPGRNAGAWRSQLRGWSLYRPGLFIALSRGTPARETGINATDPNNCST